MTKLIVLLVALVACAPPPGLAFSGATVASKQDDQASRVFLAQEQVILKMKRMYPKLEVDYRWKPCETLNSFYSPEDKTIQLCTEFAKYPKVALFVASHEVGHAVAMQFLNVDDEESADEIGALALLEMGQPEGVLDAALYWADMGDDHIGPWGHPAHNFRAWNLACMAAGSEGHPAKCVDLYQGTRLRWAKRLAKWRK